MPSLEEVRERQLLADVREDHARLSRYILFELAWLYHDEIVENKKSELVHQPYGEFPPSEKLSRSQMVMALLNHRYGEENVEWALNRLRLTV